MTTLYSNFFGNCLLLLSKVKRFNQESLDRQTHKRTEGHCQVHNLPRFAVVKDLLSSTQVEKSDPGAHFDRRELAQVDSKSSHFFSHRSARAWQILQTENIKYQISAKIKHRISDLGLEYRT